MLFDKQHVVFMVCSALIIISFLIVFFVFLKKETHKNLVLKVAALLTVIIHYSPLYVNYFATGSAEIEAPMLLPIYPCNIAMWLLLITAFSKNKQSYVFKVIAEITFYLGIIGGLFGIMLNEIYASTPDLTDWGVMNGMLSHSTMLLGCIYLLVGKYIKIRVSNLISIFIGLMFLFVDGWIIIGLYTLFRLDAPNSMFLLEPPLDSLPWFNTYLIGIFAMLLFFFITVLYEQVALKKEDRWYTKIKNRRKKQ